MKINHYNLSHQEAKEEKSYISSFIKSIWQSLKPIHDQFSAKTRGELSQICLNHIYKKSTVSITFSEKTDTFHLRLGTGQECLLSLFLFNIILEVLASTIRKENKINWEKITVLGGKNEFTNDMVVYIESFKELTKKKERKKGRKEGKKEGRKKEKQPSWN